MAQPGGREEKALETPSPAKRYALLLGFGLAILGVLGFFYSDSFSSGGEVRTEEIFGVLAINGWHNVLHVLTGVVGLLVAASPHSARLFALGAGTLYLALAIWGFVLGDNATIADLIGVNTADNILHAIVGTLGVATAISSPASPAIRRPGSSG